MIGRCFIMNGLEFHDEKSDFHNDRSRLHLFFPGVTQGKEDMGWVQDYIFSFLC